MLNRKNSNSDLLYRDFDFKFSKFLRNELFVCLSDRVHNCEWNEKRIDLQRLASPFTAAFSACIEKRVRSDISNV